MRTSVTFGYLLDKVPIRPNREICVIDAHPPTISLENMLATVGNIIKASGQSIGSPGNADSFQEIYTKIIELFEDEFSDYSALFLAYDHVTLQQNGSYLVNGQRIHPNEIRIVFRATSEDDLNQFPMGSGHNGVGFLEPPTDQIRDLGQDEEAHWYKRAFSIPLKTITPGNYMFCFAAGDNGWLYDVGAGTLLVISIVPPPVIPVPASIIADKAAEDEANSPEGI